MNKALINYLFSILLCWSIAVATTDQDIQCFLDCTQLKNIAQTQQRLVSRGFKKVHFTTSDQIQLCGLFLDQSITQKVTKTIIYCAGFYPGTKEGMSSFYSLIANQPYNVLLFDARGHNESQGSLWAYQNLKHYGTVEYRDIIAAVNFINQYNYEHNITPDIVIHGICSGAFHTIKALDYMTQNSCPECTSIKGIVFDSGWLRVCDIVETTIQAEVKKQLKDTYFSWFTKPITYLLNTLYSITLKKHYQAQPDIKDAIKKITVPIWFVHCQNDPYIPIQPMQECAQGCKSQNYWWIKHNSHANYHMTKHKEYQAKLLDFLQTLKN